MVTGVYLRTSQNHGSMRHDAVVTGRGRKRTIGLSCVNLDPTNVRSLHYHPIFNFPGALEMLNAAPGRTSNNSVGAVFCNGSILFSQVIQNEIYR